MKSEKKLQAYVTEHAENLVRLLQGLPSETELEVIQKILKVERLGNPFSKFIRGIFTFRIGGENSTQPPQSTQFYLQYFNGIKTAPEPIKEENVDVKRNIYRIFAESGLTPISYLVAGFPDAILLSSSGDMMVEEKLAGESLEERVALNNVAGTLLSRFHHFGRGVLSQVMSDSAVMEAVRARGLKPSMEKALRSLRAFYLKRNKELPSQEIEDEFAEAYSPIAEILDDEQLKTGLIHGDYGAQNLLGWEKNRVWTPENVQIIDLTNLRLGHPMIDLAKFGVSHNILLGPDGWNSAIANYINQTADIIYDIPEPRESLARRLGLKHRGEEKRTPLKPDVEKEMFSVYYAAAVSEPWKAEGYNDTLFLESQKQTEMPGFKGQTRYERLVYEKPTINLTLDQMGRNIGLALDYILANPEKFLFGDNQLEQLGRLKEFWKREGVVPGEDITKELESKIDSLYQVRKRDRV